MAQGEKALIAKPKNLSSIPGGHLVEREKPSLSMCTIDK